MGGGGGAGLTSWLRMQQVEVSTIALWKSSMQLIGFFGAGMAPVVIRVFGPLRAAQVSQGWQTSCVVLAALAFLTKRTSILLVAVAVSRLGLWCFDLAERQLLQ